MANLLAVKITKGRLWYEKDVGKIFLVNAHEFHISNVRKNKAFVRNDKFLFIEKGHCDILSMDELCGEVISNG